MQTEFHPKMPPAAVNITSYLNRGPDAMPRQNRSLPERILVAAQLLSALESVIIQKGLKVDPQYQRMMESMIATHHRLWQLRLDEPVSK